jgi:phosphatidylserine/phosphatidylglycerophosphate/cardiolipin synthase-like enzyme
MLVDSLGDDPIVATGSANFSGTSQHANDENMLVIRGHARR